MTTKEAVLCVKDEKGDLTAVVYQNGGGNFKTYMTRQANWEDLEKLLNHESDIIKTTNPEVPTK